MFVTDLCLKADKPNYWRLTQDLVWQDAQFGELIVPVGFLTDLESVPFMIRGIPWVDSVFDPDGVTRKPAAGHDFLYAWHAWGKEKSDDFLRVAIIAEGGSKSVAETVYLGVHLFGGSSWRKDDNALDKYNFTNDATYQEWLAKQK